MPNVTMKARDTIAAKLAECFITIGSRRYNFMQMIDMEAKVEKTKTTVPRLGAIMAGHREKTILLLGGSAIDDEKPPIQNF